MSQAVKKYMADEGVDDLRNTPLAGNNYEEIDSPEAIASIKVFVTKYLKVVEECDHEANNCFAPTYKNWDGSAPDYNFTTEANYGGRRDYVLADGTVIRIGYNGGDSPIDLYVDVNGKKGPNRVGYDLWNMSIFYDGVIEESDVGPECRGRGQLGICRKEESNSFERCTIDGAYGGCFGPFLENNFKFDY